MNLLEGPTDEELEEFLRWPKEEVARWVLLKLVQELLDAELPRTSPRSQESALKNSSSFGLT